MLWLMVELFCFNEERIDIDDSNRLDLNPDILNMSYPWKSIWKLI